MQEQEKRATTVPPVAPSKPQPSTTRPLSLRESDLKRVAGGVSPEIPRGNW